MSLSDEQRRFVQTVRDLAQGEFRPRAPRYMDGTFPWENMRALADLGVLGMAVPEEYGGLGLPVFDTALVLEEIAKTCYVTAMAVLGEVGVQTRIIATYAPDAVKARILPAVCSGDAILAICMTEPDAGTDVANYKTNADTGGNALKLNGVKTLISRADEAQMFVVFTRVDRRPGREGIGCVLVEKGTPGSSVTGTYHTMGGENLHEIRFEDCVFAARESGVARGRLSQAAVGFQHAALPQSQHLLGPRRGRPRRGGALCQGAPSVWPRDRRLPGHALENRRNVQGHRGRPQHAVSRLRQRRPVPRPAARRGRQDLLQRDGVARHQRGDPSAWRLRFHRRIPGLALLAWRPLRHIGRRHHRNPARPDRQACTGQPRSGRPHPGARHVLIRSRLEPWSLIPLLFL